MYTYQDYLAVGDDEKAKQRFMLALIQNHRSSRAFEEAQIAQEYYARRNRTITQYQKLLYDISGATVPDNFSANYKLPSNFFQRFVIQQTQYLLGNGVTFAEDGTKDLLGADFDTRLQELARYALVDKVAYGFWDYDRLRVFRFTEFAALPDEETGGIRAGVRFWQLDNTKPLRGTIYEEDGYTEVLWRNGDAEILVPKRGYVENVSVNTEGITEVLAWKNYPGFPIIPLWGNGEHQSELTGIQQQIDAYDLIKSGFANDLDDASQIYWTLTNAGGMDDVDLAKFVKQMKTVKAYAMQDDGTHAESHTMEVPYAGREAILSRLRSDLYDDYMALDTKIIASGAVTATQIQAAYEPINSKADLFEYQVKDFLERLSAIAGIDLSTASFTRSAIVNAQETLTEVLQSAQYLTSDYVTRKVLELLGDGDKADEIIAQISADEMIPWGDVNNDE